MKIRVPSYYKDFECIASSCEDTCCAGWDVVIDDQTYELYEKMEGTFGQRLRSKVVIDEDGDRIFLLDGDRCPFLNGSNLCDIHQEVGHGSLCHTCKAYPRYMESFGNLKEMGISLSCPEAARIILGYGGPIGLEDREDIGLGDPMEEEEKAVLAEFFCCRDTILHILEMTDMPLSYRSVLVLRFVEALQDKLDFGELDAMKEVREKFSDREHLMALVEELEKYEIQEDTKYEDILAYFTFYRDLDHIKGQDPVGWHKFVDSYSNDDEARAIYSLEHKAFNQTYKAHMDDYEKLLIYFIFRYFMKSFYDYDMSSKIKLALMSTIMIKELALNRYMETGAFGPGDMVAISHSYSKDIEHLEANVERLERTFETEEVYSVDRVINTLMCNFTI